MNRSPFSLRASRRVVVAAWLVATVSAMLLATARAADVGPPGGEVGISEVDDYTQWKQALGTDKGTDPSTFLVPPGFQIELVRSAQKDEGSWIALTFDPRGRIVIAKEDKGLLRFTLSKDRTQPVQVEVIEDTLKECRGLLFAHGYLYVNANESKGLYRLRDVNGDDRFDEVKLLYASGGSTGHGRNGLALGPDGMIYSIHGDAVDLPTNFDDFTSPFREARRGARTREGHLIRTDRDGKTWQLVASGLRNPYGIDFNPDGELFTYDADAEHDMGSPWYRPTRVLHLTAGADYGWRGVTGAWPPYYPDHPDNAPPVLDIGKGSPTGVKFGTKSSFPPTYRRALFILDWAYGRIIAVHLTARGASYVGRAETFVKGRPLNVTDLAFGPDGAMYVTTGGRKTQSGLYRISYIGPPLRETPTQTGASTAVRDAANARLLRRQLEALLHTSDAGAIEKAWPHLDSPDPMIRHAARIVIERQPLAAWSARALAEVRPTAAVTVLMALARAGRDELREGILFRLNEAPLEKFTPDQMLTALHTYALCLTPAGRIDRATATRAATRLAALYPDRRVGFAHQGGATSNSVGTAHPTVTTLAGKSLSTLFDPAGVEAQINASLSALLVELAAPQVVAKTLPLIATAATQAEQFHYLFVLRRARDVWSHADRTAYFHLLQQMDRFQGGEGMPKFIQQIRTDALAALPEPERAEFAPLFAKKPALTPEKPASLPPRPFVKEWKLEDLLDALPDVGKGRDLERGRSLYVATLCNRCHRYGSVGEAIGPDLTAIARRFSRRDILESILAPSKVVAEQYRTVQIVTREGRTYAGRVVLEGDFRSPVLRLATSALEPEQVVEIPKTSIESHTVSPVSVMPQALLNTLTRDEILDLLAYLECGAQ